MSKAKVPSTMYGYKLHPQSVLGICSWCGAPSGNTFDYTPHRTLGCDDEFVNSRQLERYSVPACPRCISKTTLLKVKLLTIEQKQIYFRHHSDKKHIAQSPLVQNAMHPWQGKLDNGEIFDLPDFVLSAYQLELKSLFYKRNE